MDKKITFIILTVMALLHLVNHPHTKLVIIDEQKICWSKLG